MNSDPMNSCGYRTLSRGYLTAYHLGAFADLPFAEGVDLNLVGLKPVFTLDKLTENDFFLPKFPLICLQDILKMDPFIEKMNRKSEMN
ncbi:hypothetical protein CEXT_806391 [Caerostris extrusa]|uniref:Uncharacterized protein n=1 Tax=Caerostris extrusa TaxID=172846 RepID=A0AAV4UCG2_CAEEX|nr:hypothetical protein CEXT_806391 [Caerostris extrusa]